MEKIRISKADNNCLNIVKQLLRESQLPYEDIDEHIKNFYLAKTGEEIIGAVGIEKYSQFGLLRSFAVKNKNRRKGIGKKLLDKIIDESKKSGITALYLLTTTAQKYFEKNKFKTIERKKLPEAIQETEEFKNICPVTAVCMYRDLQQ